MNMYNGVLAQNCVNGEASAVSATILALAWRDLVKPQEYQSG